MKEHLIKGIVREMAPVSFLELRATASPILNDEIINFFFNLIIDEGDEGKAALMINTKMTPNCKPGQFNLHLLDVLQYLITAIKMEKISALLHLKK